MHPIDAIVFILYMLAMLGMGYYFFRRNKGSEDYYVGGRNMSSLHVGLSVVATDVGGGFSIGLGGVGFLIGMSGSWMLFTGLLGAWISAVLLIPKVRASRFGNFTTFPQIFKVIFSPRVALLAGLFSGIGYIGFTSSQIRAGAKLASNTLDGLTEPYAIVIMGVIAVLYTFMGGLKAVIYTDTVQWIILMVGLIFIGLPLGFWEVGGWEGIQEVVGPEFLSLGNIRWQDLVNWGIVIIPIWFVGMTLYQRIYACRDVKVAKRAWFMAGLFEWPIMAFMGVGLGLLGRVAAEQGLFADMIAGVGSMDPEDGLPLLLKQVLPPGLMGLMLSAYLSAILSTADSCLMASSGNFASDISAPLFRLDEKKRSFLWLSQGLTLGLGIVAVLTAMSFKNVLSLMFLSYSFMVSGLLIPLLGGLLFNMRNPRGAIASMILGGGTTAILQSWRLNPNKGSLSPERLQAIKERFSAPMNRILEDRPPVDELAHSPELARAIEGAQLLHSEHLQLSFQLPLGLHPNLFGIGLSLLIFLVMGRNARKS
ncbi:MAG: sodium:solute symporter [Flavobacteriales bacterium]